MTKKTKTWLTWGVAALTLLTLAFIFTNSMEGVPASRARSEKLLELLRLPLEILVGKGNVTVQLVRKLAHFAEFGVLGAELTGLCLLQGASPVWAAFAGLLAALCDETLQIFFDRGAQLQDVWLDFSGVLAALVLLVMLKKIQKRKRC